MDKIVGLFNCSEDLEVELVKKNAIILTDSKPIPNINGCYIDWISTNSNSLETAKDLIFQSSLIKHIIKNKIPTIIFDSSFSLTNDEVVFFRKYNNIKLFEPSIFTSSIDFEPLPHCIKYLSLNEIQIDDTPRPIDVLYVGDLSDKIQAFEDNYVWLKKFWPNLNICYNSPTLIESKKKEYELLGINETKELWDKAKFTIIIGSKLDYLNGKLSKNIFDSIRHNCIPYIADEHRYYKSLPYLKRDFVASLDFYYDNYYIGHINDFYQRLKKYHPEMLVENVISIIYNRLKM